jgi:hypothetical protein
MILIFKGRHLICTTSPTASGFVEQILSKAVNDGDTIIIEAAPPVVAEPELDLNLYHYTPIWPDPDPHRAPPWVAQGQRPEPACPSAAASAAPLRRISVWERARGGARRRAPRRRTRPRRGLVV